MTKNSKKSTEINVDWNVSEERIYSVPSANDNKEKRLLCRLDILFKTFLHQHFLPRTQTWWALSSFKLKKTAMLSVSQYHYSSIKPQPIQNLCTLKRVKRNLY